MQLNLALELFTLEFANYHMLAAQEEERPEFMFGKIEKEYET